MISLRVILLLWNCPIVQFAPCPCGTRSLPITAVPWYLAKTCKVPDYIHWRYIHQKEVKTETWRMFYRIFQWKINLNAISRGVYVVSKWALRINYILKSEKFKCVIKKKNLKSLQALETILKLKVKNLLKNFQVLFPERLFSC